MLRPCIFFWIWFVFFLTDLTRIANLHYARNLQEMRIIKKQRQRICPQPSSLYLAKMSSAACRIPLKVAVKEKLPGCYTSEQVDICVICIVCVFLGRFLMDLKSGSDSNSFNPECLNKGNKSFSPVISPALML